MTRQTNTASALVWALDRAHEHAGAAAALAAAGLDLTEVDRFEGLSDDFDELVRRLPGDTPVREALALGILAGRVADRPARAPRLQDPTSFLMNEDLSFKPRGASPSCGCHGSRTAYSWAPTA